jgi:hypothetical protein
LALKAPTTSRFLIIWTWQLCTMAIRSLHGLSANFTLTPPCLNRLATSLSAMLYFIIVNK